MPDNNQYDQELLNYVKQVRKICSSRARFVIDKILEDGQITSEDLRNEGYVHGARAIGDVRDNGIPLITKKTKSSTGRNIAYYVFGSAADIKKHKFGGRINFPANLKKELVKRNGTLCSISGHTLPESELQIDHRIPYYISGDISGRRDVSDYMLLSRSMQRAKSWACDNCENIKKHFDKNICRTCYWAYPEDYEHVAMHKERHLNITWQESEVDEYDKIKAEAKSNNISMQQLIKNIIKKFFS